MPENVLLASYIKASSELHFAREVIGYVREVLYAYQLTKGMEQAPDLIPVVQYLLTQANGNMLCKAEEALMNMRPNANNVAETP